MEPWTCAGSRNLSDLNWPFSWNSRKPSKPSVSAADNVPLTPAFQPSFSDCGRAPAKRWSSRSSISILVLSRSARGTNVSFPPQEAVTALSAKIFVSMSLG
jgi:hypothetical protein